MPRWDFLQRDSGRDFESRNHAEERRQEQASASASVGRGPSDSSPANQPEKLERREQSPSARSVDRKIERDGRGRGYSLSNREIQAMADVGTFRTVDVQDLKRFAYAGDQRAMSHDLRELRRAGLIEEKTLLRAHKEPRKVLALTEKGQRIVRNASGLPKDQALYHGFVKPREIEHDADLYKVYQHAVEKIRNEGGKPLKVRLDFELKGAVQREKNTVKALPQEEQKKRLEAFARERTLAINGTKIHVPDVQLEYETRDGELERANLELVSENYRNEGIRGKAESGFAIYARGEDSARIRRALQDTHTVERILRI
jgi:DNA-binding MarR family transcriptional regulator